MMGRKPAYLLLSVLPVLFFGVSACGSSTDLANVDLVGRWDGVGALQSSDDGANITVYIHSHSGSTFTGSWKRVQANTRTGAISDASFQNGEITFHLDAFPGTDPTFTGRLTDGQRMAGSMDPLSLNGQAVFRRGSRVPQ